MHSTVAKSQVLFQESAQCWGDLFCPQFNLLFHQDKFDIYLITLLSIIFLNIVVLKGKSCFGSSNVCKVEKTCQEPLCSDGKPAKSKWNKSSVKSKSGKTSKSDSSKGPVFIGPSLPPHQIEESLPYLKVYMLKF